MAVGVSVFVDGGGGVGGSGIFDEADCDHLCASAAGQRKCVFAVK